MKKKYFINGFKHLYDCFSKVDHTYEYSFVFPKYSQWDFYTNHRLIRTLEKNRDLDHYDIIHMNTWESILTYNPKTKKEKQITIAEAHGFFVGINFNATIRELPLIKKIPNFLLKLLFDRKMPRRIRQYDIFYVSTPNMIEHGKKIRKDCIWLPNPINTDIFNIIGPRIKLEGNPAIFLPTRLHAFKNPLFGIRLYQKIKKRYPNARLHMIRYGRGADPLFNEFKKMVNDDEVLYHDRMPAEELAKFYRSADLVLGQFNEKLGNLSMVELEAMACGAPIVTLDRYEIKKEFADLSSLERLAFKLLSNEKFKKGFVKRNFLYVKKVHSEKAVSELNLKSIKGIQKKSKP